MSSTGISTGKSDYSGRDCDDLVAIEIISNGIAVIKYVCLDEVLIACFTESIEQYLSNFDGDPAIITVREESTC